MDINNKQKKKRILIIDDNKQIHLDFKKILLISKEKKTDLDKLEQVLLGNSERLQHDKYIIDCAFQGEEGLKMVEKSLKKNEPYAVAFVDVRMPPGWDGIETISRIWKIHPDLQVVICTAYSDYSWEEVIEKLGYSDNLFILKKPFDNIEARQLAFALSEKWELTKIASLKMSDLERNVEERTKELNEIKTRLQNLYDYAPDMYFSVKPDGTVLSVNQFGAECLGYTTNELIGESVWIIVYKDDLKRVQKQVSEIFSKKLIKSELEFRKTRKDGSIIWVHERTHLFLDNDGNPEELLVMCRDITERKQAEKALRESEERFRTIFKTAQDSIFVKDLSLKYTQVNPTMESIFGLTASKLIGLTDDDLFDKEAALHIREVDSRVLKGEIVKEEHTKKVKGVSFTFHIIKVPMRDSFGEIIGLCGIARDITERKQVENTLHEKINELQLFYNVAKDREARIIELKKDINELLARLGEKKKYGV